jgi:micrococcal nuclease
MPVPDRFRISINALLLLAAMVDYAHAKCVPPDSAETVTVRHVHDGDTLILEDKRKLRLLGYNTPEVERRERPAEALAIEAKERLAHWIEAGDRQIRLQYDAERKDRYERTLAHAFLQDGASIAELMLEAGLATSLILPPNLRHADCYSAAENRARAKNHGVWGLPAYHAADLNKLEAHRDRYTVLRAGVLKLEQNTGGFVIWLGTHENMPQVRAFIAGRDLELFPQQRLKTLTGRKIEVRGWLHRRDRIWTLQLRHPSSLDIL